MENDGVGLMFRKELKSLKKKTTSFENCKNMRALFTNHVGPMSVKSFEYQCFADLVSGHFTQSTLHITGFAVIPEEDRNCDNTK